MAQRDDAQGKSYDVGYAKPPVATRFAKGQSGNPLGRPRKKNPEPLKPSDGSFLELFTEEAYREVTLRENGQLVQLPAIKAAMRSTWAGAIKGGRLPQKFAFGMAQLAEAERQKSESSKYEWLWALKARGRRIITECERSGRPVPELYPHPDDIIVDPLSGEAHVDGPLSREHDDYCKYIAAARDFYVLFSELLKRTGCEVFLPGPESKQTCGFLILAYVANFKLPTRYRWSKLKDSDGPGETTKHQAFSREDNVYECQGFALAQECSRLPLRELRRRVKAGFAHIAILQSKCPNLASWKDEALERKINRWHAKRVAEYNQRKVGAESSGNVKANRISDLSDKEPTA